MKTFDEAWEQVITQDKSKFSADLNCAREYFDTHSWVEEIISLAKEAIIRGANCRTDSELLGTVGGALHAAFQLGVLTGIAMEKEEIK